MRALALVLLVGIASAAPTKINQEHVYRDLTRLPQSRIEVCKAGCYVLTFDELMGGLRAAREAGRRERANLSGTDQLKERQ